MEEAFKTSTITLESLKTFKSCRLRLGDCFKEVVFTVGMTEWYLLLPSKFKKNP